MTNFKLIEGSDGYVESTYAMGIASLMMLNKLRDVKASLDQDITKIYILENRVAPLYNTSDEELDEITGIYDKYIRQFVLDKAYAHIVHIFRYWSMVNTKSPRRFGVSTINTISRFVDTMFSDPSYNNIIYNLLVDLRHEDDLEDLQSSCSVLPNALRLKLTDKCNQHMAKTKPTYENLNDFVDIVELLVRCCKMVPRTSMTSNNLCIDPSMRSNLNDRSHMTLETVVCATPKTIYYGLSKGTFYDRSDSLSFAISAEFFYNNIPSFTKKNYNTMSFGTETDR